MTKKEKNIASITPPLRVDWKYFNLFNNSISIPFPEKTQVIGSGESLQIKIPEIGTRTGNDMSFVITPFKQKITDFNLFAMNFCENLLNFHEYSIFRKSKSLYVFAIDVCHDKYSSEVNTYDGDIYFLGLQNKFFQIQTIYGYSNIALVSFMTSLLNAKNNDSKNTVYDTDVKIKLPLNAQKEDPQLNFKTSSGTIALTIDGPYTWTGSAIDWTNKWCGLGSSIEREKYTRADGTVLTDMSTLCSYAKNYLVQKNGELWRVYAKQETTDYDTLWSALGQVTFY
jgi:hypothetical protein